MLVVNTKKALRELIKGYKSEGKTIGFVPTMGALHEGHISLIKAANQASDITISSIFVNPKQFNNSEDLQKYPRTAQADTDQLKEAGCDVLFMPSESEVYLDGETLQLSFGSLEHVMEGAARPGHFSGVGLIVSKLFNLVQPDKAYFGLKDLQQCTVISKLVADLDFPIEIIKMPTVRAHDGLALSSRNARLNPSERTAATILYRSLIHAQSLLSKGVAVKEVIDHSKSMIAQEPLAQLDYFEVVDTKELKPLTNVQGQNEVAICIACFIGSVRLIDNLVFIP